MTGLYIHIPFCARKCPYCDFYSLPFGKTLAESYVGAIECNIRAFAAKGVSIDTVYFGGGTPSLLSSQQVQSILAATFESFEVKNAEITLEANPCTVSYDKLCRYREAGVNRLSFGVQSAIDSELKRLGRLHDFKTAQRAVFDAAKAGFDNISCDVMLAAADQTFESLQESVAALTSLPVQHISAYMLKIEQGTPYDCDEIRNAAADDELAGSMYLQTVAQLENAGFAQYEISNFAKQGFESRHNLKYWTGESYIGIGASAHSFFDGKRYYCPNDVNAFVSSQKQVKLTEDENPDSLQEYLMLTLRLNNGISLERVKQLGGNSEKLAQKAGLYAGAGLCRLAGDSLSLTPQGFLVSNSLISELIEAASE